MKSCFPLLLKTWLSHAVVRIHIGTVHTEQSGEILLLDTAVPGWRSDALYIGAPHQLAEKLAHSPLPAEGAQVVTTVGPAFDEIPPQLTLLETDLPLIPLYNHVQSAVRRFEDWNARLQKAVYQNSGLQRLLEIGSEEIHATLQLLNPGYKHLAGVYHPNVSDPIVDEIQSQGYHSYETIQQIHTETLLYQAEDRSWAKFCSSISGNYIITHLIRYNKNIVARLCVILPDKKDDPYYEALCEILAHYITEYMCSGQGVDYSSNADLGSLLADLIECRLTDPAELEQRLKQLKLAVTRYYHVVLLRLEYQQNQDAIPWNYIIGRLERIFPFSNITTYRGDILILARKTKRGNRLPLDRSRLIPLLEQFNGYIGISNTSEFLTSLPPVYHQIEDALRIGRVMDPEQRIFYYEDYSMYQIIELAAEAASHRLNSRNLVHLCNNALIALMLYDKKNGTNLVEVLHVYLLNERNASETAKILYLHRNTMLYKIRKIEEILGDSLNDPVLRQRLLFSYDVLTYMNQYRKENILELKRAPRPKADPTSEIINTD